ncbi:MAG: pyruvate formate lyase family protein [Myxococcales bacterium]|nr:pyruvate formate lyase family protein [Myxococcales bacterium]
MQLERAVVPPSLPFAASGTRRALHPKNAAMKERLLTAEHWLCIERARFVTEVWREQEGLHPSLLAAKALANVFEKMTVRLEPEELLVGNRASKPIAPPLAPERGDFTFVFQHLLEELERFGYRITPEDRRELLDDLIPWWSGRTVRDAKVAALQAHGLDSPPNTSPRELVRKLRAFGLRTLARVLTPRGGTKGLVKRLPRLLRAISAGASDTVKGRGRCTDTQAHIVPGHKNVLALGFSGIAAQTKARLERASTDDERAFLEAVLLTCDAMRSFSARFAALARAQADGPVTMERRVELLELATTCERVPWLPPRSFAEALQSLWFVQNAAIISYGAGSGITPGRVDQLLFPFYEADLSRGAITPEHALRLLEEFVIKLNDNVVIWPNLGGVELNHLGSDVENITIGGVDALGHDATNALSWLFIEAVENTSLATTASFRVSVKSPPEYVRRVVELHRRTNSPAFLGDETAIATLMNDGYPLEAARDYCLVGCVEPSGNGDTFGATGGTKVYFPTALDLVFNRGRTTFFGNQDGPDTGDPRDFRSFDELLEAFFQQLGVMVANVTEATRLRDGIWAARFHNPLISCTIDGCIESARDMTRGGARYNFGAVGGGGLGTIIDSLATVRALVFEQGSLTMDELLAALRCNFRGHEALRQRLLAGPRFGVDDRHVDALAVLVVARFCELVRAQPTVTGGHFKASLISYGLNVYEGALEPATPDGRFAGAPLSNSMSPSNGAETKGPTAALNSLSRIDQTRIGYGNSLNMRLPIGLLGSEKGVDAVVGLVRAYFAKGGFHVQFNAADAATLRAAQERPGDFKDLIVRVSGYSAYFTRLGRCIQEDLIARVELSP